MQNLHLTKNLLTIYYCLVVSFKIVYKKNEIKLLFPVAIKL